MDKLQVIQFSLEEINDDKREDEDGDKQKDGDDDFFLIKNMEESESAVVDFGKDHIDQKVLPVKDGRTKKTRYNTTSLQHRRRQG